MKKLTAVNPDAGVALLGICLDSHPRFQDAGNFVPDGGASGFMAIEETIAAILHHHRRPLILGGDHAIIYPILRAVCAHHGPVNILHFDAHPDLYDELDGNRLSHASPFARIMEQGLAKKVVQVGIRTLNAHQKEQAQRFGVKIHEMKSFDSESFLLPFDGPLYLSFDMDTLDPAYAPGVSHFEPGGLSVRQVLSIFHRLSVPVVGADIVEYNPRRDLHQMTAMVGAKLVKEIAGKMLSNK
jgi:arginase